MLVKLIVATAVGNGRSSTSCYNEDCFIEWVF